jgi:hypothetical protein
MSHAQTPFSFIRKGKERKNEKEKKGELKRKKKNTDKWYSQK